MNAGDRRAFEAIYHRHRDWILRLALRATGHHDDAIDVLQETFAYFFGKFPGFELTARLTTFLYRPIQNLSIAARRKRKRLNLDPAPGVDQPSPADPSSSINELAGVLDCLPDGQREALLLRYVDGLNLAEIAQMLGIPEGTVKSRIHHALATLRQDPKTRRYFDQAE